MRHEAYAFQSTGLNGPGLAWGVKRAGTVIYEPMFRLATARRLAELCDDSMPSQGWDAHSKVLEEEGYRLDDPAAEIPKAVRFVKAEVETRNFHFEAYGASEREALEALRAGLTRHSEQYAARGVSAQWVDDCMESPRITAITVGTCYRDHEALTGSELSSDRETIAGGSQAKPKG